MEAQRHGVIAKDFINVTNWSELVSGTTPARSQQATAPALRESLDDWRSRHTARQEQREFKRALAADVAIVATQDEPRRFASLTDDVLQESFLFRMAGRQSAASRQEWVRSHRNPR